MWDLQWANTSAGRGVVAVPASQAAVATAAAIRALTYTYTYTQHSSYIYTVRYASWYTYT